MNRLNQKNSYQLEKKNYYLKIRLVRPNRYK